MVETVKLAEVRRDEVVESVHRGIIVIVNAMGRRLFALGNPQHLTYFRSAAKPIQALAVIESGAAVEFNFTLKDVAIISSSHSGEPGHCEQVIEVLEKIGLGEECLRCGARPPRHKLTYEQLLIQGREPSPLHNECSGKHAGMLALARFLKQPLETYYLPEHQVQQEMLNCLADLVIMDPEDIPLGIDGCNVPTYALPLDKMAYAYARLAEPTDMDEMREAACEIVKGALTTHPFLVAGTDRFTTDLMKATKGRLLAKDGAEGIFCVGLPEPGWGIAVKMEDGSDRAIPPVVISLLHQIGAITDKEKAVLADYSNVVLTNAVGQVIGEIRPTFKVDVE